MQENKKSYYAIIPANVRYDKSLIPNAKLLYGEITALCNEKGYCWAGNEYFAELYEVSKETISRWVSQLKEKEYIAVQMQYKEGTKQIISRYIRITQEPIDENINTPVDEKLKDNTTSFNTTSCKTDRQKINDLFSTGYQSLYNSKFEYLPKETGNITNLLKFQYSEIEQKFKIYYKLCQDKPDYYKLLPSQFYSNWLKLVVPVVSKQNKILTAKEMEEYMSKT